jgi:MFS family permease
MSVATRQQDFRWFMAGQASWFSAFGLQAVLFPFLIVNILFQGPEHIGLAQSALMAPSLLLMMLGGAVADANDLRRLLIYLQLLAALPPLVLAATILLYGPSYIALIAYAVAYGSIQAFILPARDAMLHRVAGADMQRAVTSATAIQFASQIVGFVVGAGAKILGAPGLLLAQAVLLAFGAAATRRLPPTEPIRDPTSTPASRGAGARLSEMAGGVSEVWCSARLRPVVLLMSGVGLFFISVFMVLLPVMVRDIYHGSSGSLALINGAFVMGTITSTVVLMRRLPVVHQGRAMVLALMGGASLVATFSLELAQPQFYAHIYVFGCGAGIVMSIGRTIVQESARATHRARIMAVYNLSFLGAAPVGAFCLGHVAAAIGVLQAALVCAAGMACLLVLMLAFTPVWGLRREVDDLPAHGQALE